MRISSRPRLAASLLAAAITLTAAGCSSDDDPAATSTPSAGASSAATSPPTTAPVSPTGTPEATVVPAVGKTIDRGSYTFVLPDGFTDGGGVANGLLRTRMYINEQLAAFITVRELTDITTTMTLEEASQLGGDERDPALVRQPDREVAGAEVYVFTGKVSTGEHYEIGRVVGDEIVDIDFSYGLSPLDPALVESVLATVQWNE